MGNWAEYLAIGVEVKDGGSIPLRKELRDLSAIEIYLLREGLAKFQNERPMDDPKSWYQIAGIHGMPYATWPDKAWNGDIPRKAPDGAFAGFCTHTSIIFLTWHRPYLALFGKILYDHVNDVAKGISDTFSDKQAYLDAAENFRLPYWDWARKGVTSYFPEIALNDTYDQTGPKSDNSWFKNNAVYNPLHHAPFPNGVQNTYITKGRKVTARYPADGSKGPTNLNAAIESFYQNQRNFEGIDRNLSERVAYTLLAYQRYRPMSNNEWDGAAKKDPTNNAEVWGSLEDIHNVLHGRTGGANGQMSDPSIAAFDPIFWLHHCNIDRLFAIWQALHEDDNNPEAWVTDRQTGRGTWSNQRGDIEGEKTPLYPFRPTETLWYNSSDATDADSLKTSVKRTEPFGYTYPETEGLSYPLSADALADLRNKIQSYYTNLPRELRRSKAKDPRAGQRLLPQVALLKDISEQQIAATTSESIQLVSQLPAREVLLEKSNEPEKPFIRDLAPENEYLEWLVNIKAEKHALGGKYSVHVFLGPVEENDVSLWALSPHYVGAFVPFGQPQDTQCGKCQEGQQDHVQITSQIPLTIALVERYLAQILPDITPDTVVPYLTQNLHWRVESEGNALPSRAAVDGLTVFVVSNKVTLPEDERQAPVYANEVTIYPEITTNRNGQGRGDGTGLTQS